MTTIYGASTAHSNGIEFEYDATLRPAPVGLIWNATVQTKGGRSFASGLMLQVEATADVSLVRSAITAAIERYVTGG